MSKSQKPVHPKPPAGTAGRGKRSLVKFLTTTQNQVPKLEICPYVLLEDVHVNKLSFGCMNPTFLPL
eukprot:1159401-Pelagomonas_calceolata.AAC.2